MTTPTAILSVTKALNGDPAHRPKVAHRAGRIGRRTAAELAIDKYLGQVIRARRIELGISQEKLAEAIGLTFQQLQKYENALNRVSLSKLFLIAAALETPVEYFFAKLPRAAATDAAAVPPAPLAGEGERKLLELARHWRKLGPNKQRRVYDLVRTLAAEQEVG